MRSPGAKLLAGMLLLCAVGAAAHGQSTRPINLGETYQDRDLPARRGAPTTQSAVAGTSVGGQGDFMDIKRIGLAMLIVLGAIYISNRVWKRLGMPGSLTKASGSLQVVSRLAVSPKQQILLIRVGRRLVLVGNSGTQMNPLTEIVDPEETAGIIGQAAVEREESSVASFNDVLGGEEKQFDPIATNVDVPPGEQAPSEDDPSMATTREELQGLMDKVRGLSQQFRQQQQPSPGEQG